MERALQPTHTFPMLHFRCPVHVPRKQESYNSLVSKQKVLQTSLLLDKDCVKTCPLEDRSQTFLSSRYNERNDV